MPKKILFESAVHQFLAAAKRLGGRLSAVAPAESQRLGRWIAGLSLEYPGSQFRVSWSDPRPGAHVIPLKGARFYTRGDTRPPVGAEAAVSSSATLSASADPVESENRQYFDEQLRAVLAAADLFEGSSLETLLEGAPHPSGESASRKQAEELFHDEWAAGVDVAAINVRQMNEACTAPEMRYIRAQLGDLRGRRLLDVGCGLGEASVYFAMLGADVTASDISPGMLDATQRLAAANGVSLRTAQSAAEDLGLDIAEPFDVIYTGNTLHHCDIAATLDRLLPYLKPDGVFVSWDPVAYNPVINVYRRMATSVRTEDEHPLRMSDIRGVRSRFESSHIRWFWLTTLLIFILMAVVQRRSPNKERYWKKVVEEADRWAWLYWPLAWLDRVLLTCLPFLGPLCWNVVIVARRPIRTPRTAPPNGNAAERPEPRCSMCEAPVRERDGAYTECSACGHRDAGSAAVCGVVDNGQLRREEAERLDGLTRAQVALAVAVAPARQSLLDFGAGTGKFLLHAREAFADVAGVEVSDASLRFAREDLALNVTPELSSLRGPFDVVTTWHALEHIPGEVLPSLIREIRSRCHDRSVVVVCVPNPDSRLALWFGSAWAFRDPAAHLHEFSRRSLDRLLARGGFRPVETRRILAYTGFAWVQSLANLSPLPHNYLYYRLKRGADFGWSRWSILAGDLLAWLWLAPAAVVGGVLAAWEYGWAREKTVHTVVYRPSVS